MIRNKDARVDLRIFSIVSALFRYMVINIEVQNRPTHAISKSGKYPSLDNLLLIFSSKYGYQQWYTHQCHSSMNMFAYVAIKNWQN